MEFHVQYRVDDVGFYKTMTAADAEKARVKCEEEIKTAYPLSACSVISVEKVEKVKKSKDAKEEE